MSPFFEVQISSLFRLGGLDCGKGAGIDECQGGRSRFGGSKVGSEASSAARGGGAIGVERSAVPVPGPRSGRGQALIGGQAAVAPVSGGWRGGFGFPAPGAAAQQRHGSGHSPGGYGLGGEALCGLWSDLGVREADRGARVSAVGGDLASMDDRRRAMEGEVEAPYADSPAASPAGVFRRVNPHRLCPGSDTCETGTGVREALFSSGWGGDGRISSPEGA